MRDSLLYQYEMSSPARPTCPSRIAAAEYASSVKSRLPTMASNVL